MSEEKNKKRIPNSVEDYKIKFIFKDESIVDVDNVIKECFLMKLKNMKV